MAWAGGRLAVGGITNTPNEDCSREPPTNTPIHVPNMAHGLEALLMLGGGGTRMSSTDCNMGTAYKGTNPNANDGPGLDVLL